MLLEPTLSFFSTVACICLMLLPYAAAWFRLSQQLQQPGCPLLPVALKVMDCNEDDACCFERVYNEVG